MRKSNLFKPANFEEARDAVVGDCNGITMKDRWDKETPLFAKAINENIITNNIKLVVDYGCGVGRIAKAILNINPDVKILGIDRSKEFLSLAQEYVDSNRFTAIAPEELDTNIDLVYSIYVLQHIPAIEIRDTLYRIHHYLSNYGLFINCCSDFRMAMRFDADAFYDDRHLGVNLKNEIKRCFVEDGELFSASDFENMFLNNMVNGPLPHPSKIYMKRDLVGPLFNQEYNKL